MIGVPLANKGDRGRTGTACLDGCSRGRPRDHRVDEAIAAATLNQISQVGYGAITLEAIATKAGVSRAAIYRRYKDKADLVTAIIASSSASPIGPSPKTSNNPREDLARFLKDFDARFAESCLEVIGGLMGTPESPNAMALHRSRVVAPRLAYAKALLKRAVELGELDPNCDVDLGVDMLLGAVFARRVSGEPSSRGWVSRALDALWVGMAP